MCQTQSYSVFISLGLYSELMSSDMAIVYVEGICLPRWTSGEFMVVRDRGPRHTSASPISALALPTI